MLRIVNQNNVYYSIHTYVQIATIILLMYISLESKCLRELAAN